MINVQLTDDQVISMIDQLTPSKKKELLEHLKFEQWLESEEALKMKERALDDVKHGRTHTLDEVREKLRKNGKSI